MFDDTFLSYFLNRIHFEFSHFTSIPMQICYKLTKNEYPKKLIVLFYKGTVSHKTRILLISIFKDILLKMPEFLMKISIFLKFLLFSRVQKFFKGGFEIFLYGTEKFRGVFGFFFSKTLANWRNFLKWKVFWPRKPPWLRTWCRTWVTFLKNSDYPS